MYVKIYVRIIYIAISCFTNTYFNNNYLTVYLPTQREYLNFYSRSLTTTGRKRKLESFDDHPSKKHKPSPVSE